VIACFSETFCQSSLSVRSSSTYMLWLVAFDIECKRDLSGYSNDILPTNKLWHNRRGEDTDIVIQFSISNPALNLVVLLISYHVR
jgi:hypothetical protein